MTQHKPPWLHNCLKLMKGPGFSQLLWRQNGTVISPMPSPAINL